MSLLTALLAVPGVLYAYHYYLNYRRKGEAPILWSWVPFLGHALELGKRPVQLIKECAERSSEDGIFGMIVAGHRTFIITDPHSFHLVLRPRKELSYVEFTNLVLTKFFGASKRLYLCCITYC